MFSNLHILESSRVTPFTTAILFQYIEPILTVLLLANNEFPASFDDASGPVTGTTAFIFAIYVYIPFAICVPGDTHKVPGTIAYVNVSEIAFPKFKV